MKGDSSAGGSMLRREVGLAPNQRKQTQAEIRSRKEWCVQKLPRMGNSPGSAEEGWREQTRLGVGGWTGNCYSSSGEKGEDLTWGGKHPGSKSAKAEVEMCLWKACDSYSYDINRDVYVSFFLAEPHGIQDLNSHQGSNLCPMQWKCGVLTSGLLGKSQICMFPCFTSRLGRHNLYPSVYLRRVRHLWEKGAPNSDHTLRITSRSLERAELRYLPWSWLREQGHVSSRK